MTAQNRFYRPISEQDTQAGYVDIFLCPMLDIYSDMTHSYIVELKYAKYKDPETLVEKLRQEAITLSLIHISTVTLENTALKATFTPKKAADMSNEAERQAMVALAADPNPAAPITIPDVYKRQLSVPSLC